MADCFRNFSPFPEKDGLFPNSDNLREERSENIINISLTSAGQERASNLQIPTQPCQTTINLYINDPHIMQNSWDKNRKVPLRRNTRNDIVLGKNIPNHTLMKELLGDLGVKKYSSAPNMTNKYSNHQRRISINAINTSGSSTHSTEVGSQEEIYRMSSLTNQKSPIYPYVNVRKSAGDYSKEKIFEVQGEENKKNFERKTEQKEKLKDPMARFKKKPLGYSQISRNPPIVHKDTIVPKLEHVEPPKKSQQCFNVRSGLVKDILNAQPAITGSYQSDLMRNHKKLFDSLRRTSFQEILEEDEAFEKDLPKTENRKIDPLDVKQTKLIFCGKTYRPACSVESHGPYEEYRRNLVKAPDGSLCCRQIDLKDDDEEMWTRAVTRSIITSEFVKNKVKKFDRLIGKFSNRLEGQNSIKKECMNDRNRRSEHLMSNFHHQDILSHNLLNEEPVSFPRETKNAMTRLLSENAKRSVNNFHITRPDTQVKETRENVPIRRRSSYIPTTCGNTIKNEDRCQQGVAERSRSTAEENTAACGS